MEGSNKWESPQNGGFQKPLRAAKLWREKPRAIPLTRKGCAMASVSPAIETRETRAQRSGGADGIKPGAQPRSTAASEARSAEPWENTNNATPPEKSRISADLRSRSYERRGRSRAMMVRWHGGEQRGFDPLALPRCAKCGMSVKSAVGISTNGKRSAFSGVMRCGSIWACPVCSGIIRTARADEVSKMVERNASGALVFGTLTVRHHAGMPLQMLLDAVMAGWQKMVTGSPWKRMRQRYGVQGYVRATEVTYSRGNGWHPHIHFIMPLDAPLSDEEAQALRAWLIDRWRSMVMRVAKKYGDWDIRPDDAHGIDLQVKHEYKACEKAAEYITKWQADKGMAEIGMEIARGDAKSGRAAGSINPFQLLDEGMLGLSDSQRDALWHEYYAATMRRRCITWSRGLRERYEVEEVEDEEIVAAEDKPEELVEYVAPRRVYERLRKTAPALLADVLEAAERCDWAFVDSVLHGVHLTDVQQDMLADGEADLLDFLPKKE